MNTQPIEALANARMRDIRREIAQCRRPEPRPESEPSSAERVPRLRNRIGFTLVEAGLHLMATARPLPRD
jgi:hypothetical protein